MNFTVRCKENSILVKRTNLCAIRRKSGERLSLVYLLHAENIKRRGRCEKKFVGWNGW